MAILKGDTTIGGVEVLNKLSTLAPLASPSFSGSPTVPTASYSSSGTKIANQSYVINALDSLKIRRGHTCVVAPYGSTYPAQAVDYKCSSSGNQSTINSAISAAGEGEVLLLNGTYNISGSINVNGDITLRGMGAGTILKNTTTSGIKILNISYNNNIIENLKIQGNSINDYGIYVTTNNNYDTIHNCYITNCMYAIYLYYAGMIVSNNFLMNNKYGIYGTGCNTGVISDNYLASNSTTDIYMDNLNQCTVTGNLINVASAGITLNGSSRNCIGGNNLVELTSSKTSIYLSGTANNYNLIEGNLIYGKNYTSNGGNSNTFTNNKYS